MIAPVYMRTATTHGVAVLLGLGFSAMFFSNNELPDIGETSEATGRPAKRARHHPQGNLTSSEAYRTTYQALASHPMSAEERRRVADELFKEWGNRDPLGLLTFLEEKRAWPVDFSFSSHLGDLVLDRPDVLLDFALRNGCDDPLRQLAHGDPVTVSRLIDALPESEKGAGIRRIEELVHEKMGRLGIEMAVPTHNYLKGAALAQLEEGRLDEFFTTFGMIDAADTKEWLASRLGGTLADGRLDAVALEAIAKLPLEWQSAAISRMYDGSRGTMVFSESREERRTLIGKLTGLELAEVAKDGVSALFEDEVREEVNRETLDWVMGFPPDDSWKLIEEAVFSYWARFDLPAMANEISLISDDAIRARMAEGAVRGVRSWDFSEEAKPNLARLIALTTDPEVLRQFEEEDNAPAVDPFADPFAE